MTRQEAAGSIAGHQDMLKHPPKPCRRQREKLPEPIRQPVLAFAEQLRTEFAAQFTADRRLKHRLARLLASLLPPKPRQPGRPVTYPEVTKAYRMMNKLRREHPRVPYRDLWQRVYPVAITGYEKLDKLGKRAARHGLRERVRWRRRDRKRALRRNRILK
jgi:hypothetical protein